MRLPSALIATPALPALLAAACSLDFSVRECPPYPDDRNGNGVADADETLAWLRFDRDLEGLAWGGVYASPSHASEDEAQPGCSGSMRVQILEDPDTGQYWAGACLPVEGTVIPYDWGIYAAARRLFEPTPGTYARVQTHLEFRETPSCDGFEVFDSPIDTESVIVFLLTDQWTWIRDHDEGATAREMESVSYSSLGIWLRNTISPGDTPTDDKAVLWDNIMVLPREH